MTREEAIKLLADARYADDLQGNDDLQTAHIMAMKALEQEPCEDCISRDAVVYYIKGHIHEIITESGEDKSAHTNRVVRALINGVETMPSVTPKQKTGHWEYVQYDYNPKFGNWHCSECRCIAVECANKEKENSNPLYKYCPNCGAKMESEVKEHGERTSN